MSPMKPRRILLVGEICVDVTLLSEEQENKLRLGGIVHAARGFWALDQPYAVAAILPSYLEASASKYLGDFGCGTFYKLGDVIGAPNVTLIRDAAETANQGYETLLRDEKAVELTSLDLRDEPFDDILVFPGSYSLSEVCERLPNNAALHLDVAYDLERPELLASLHQQVETVMISTSSPLFLKLGAGDLATLVAAFSVCDAKTLILKENRGGSRLAVGGKTFELPAQLGETVNSVGVGDVFAAAYLANLHESPYEAGLRATRSAAAYSQTTYPSLFKTYVRRDQLLTFEDLEMLGGVSIPWEARKRLNIYFAAPDFTYVDRRYLQRAIASLEYHNFALRRPVMENGEMAKDATMAELSLTYKSDYALLLECHLVFAVPVQRDPGTLVEIGMAIRAGIPVVVYDPTEENNNTMVMAGAHHYSSDLDSCLNATFTLLSQGRAI